MLGLSARLWCIGLQAAPQTSIATFRLPVDNSVPVALGLLPRAPRASSGTGRGSRPSSSRAPSQPQSRAHSLTLTDRDAAQAMESGAAGTGAGVAGGEGSQGMGAAGKGADDGAGDAAQTTEPSYDADSVSSHSTAPRPCSRTRSLVWACGSTPGKGAMGREDELMCVITLRVLAGHARGRRGRWALISVLSHAATRHSRLGGTHCYLGAGVQYRRGAPVIARRTLRTLSA